MRLRLTIRRNGLPETSIVWLIDTSSAPTVYQLLEQVNEIIPIESDGDWGLEDYVVELKGINGVNYECLHFQPVASILKEDDEVIIRCLLTHDVKKRRVSGRTQITSDGKRLFDGVPFGRPFLKKSAHRPAVKIHPKKQRRAIDNVEDDEDDDKEWEAQNEGKLLALQAKEDSGREDNTKSQLILNAEFDDENDDDEDFTTEDFDENATKKDVQDTNDADIEPNKKNPLQPDQQASRTEGLTDEDVFDISDSANRTKIRKLLSAFPTSSVAVCKHILRGTHGDMGEAWEALCRGFSPRKSKNSVTEMLREQGQRSILRARAQKRTSGSAEPNSVESMEIEFDGATAPIIHHFDQNGLPPGSIKSGKALSHMAEAIHSSPIGHPDSRRSNSVLGSKSLRFAVDKSVNPDFTSTPVIELISPESPSSSASSDGSYESSESNDETDEEGSKSGSHSNSDSSTDSTDLSNDSNEESASSDSDSDSSNDTTSDGEAPEETSRKLEAALERAPNRTVPLNTSLASLVRPGMGSRSTHKRNDRRRNTNQLRRFLKKGILPAGTTLAEFKKLRDLGINDETSVEDAAVELEVIRRAAVSNESKDNRKENIEDEFQRRRQELLVSLASGSIEVEVSSTTKKSKNEPLRSSVVRDTLTDEVAGLQTAETTKSPDFEPSELSRDGAKSQSTDENHSRAINTPEIPMIVTSKPSESRLTSVDLNHKRFPDSRRSTLDLGAGKRILFSALGFKNPKTKYDEEQIRSTIDKNIKIVKAAQTVEPETTNKEDLAQEDPDAWREKINYRAVECVQEGVELSEPPFPFIQRWDPQQRGDCKKRKKTQCDKTKYYNDDPRPSKKQKQRKDEQPYAEQQQYLKAHQKSCYEDESMHNLKFDESKRFSTHSNKDVEGELDQHVQSNVLVPTGDLQEDLISLPDDLSSLKDLLENQVKIGMIIAFKQLEVSARTKWQPQVSAYRTAMIASSQNGQLHIFLARRDREAHEKIYDESGARIYSGFDTIDDDAEGEDDGQRDISFSELISPKIVLPPVSENAKGRLQLQEGCNTGESLRLGHRDDPEVKFSQFSKTLLHSVTPESQHPHNAVNEVFVEFPCGNGPDPRLSRGQLFTSHMSDHGYQPEINFVDTLIPDGDVALCNTDINDQRERSVTDGETNILPQIPENILNDPSGMPKTKSRERSTDDDFSSTESLSQHCMVKSESQISKISKTNPKMQPVPKSRASQPKLYCEQDVSQMMHLICPDAEEDNHVPNHKNGDRKSKLDLDDEEQLGLVAKKGPKGDASRASADFRSSSGANFNAERRKRSK